MTIDEAIDVYKHPTQHFSSEHREADKIAIQSMEELKAYKQKSDGWMYEQIRNQLTKIFDISESYEEYRYIVNILCRLNKDTPKDIIYLIAQEVSGFEVSM